jgi:hypothetical protein
MHAARLATSSRLRDAMTALAQHPRGLTTREWCNKAGIEAASAVAAELRENGLDVKCKYIGRRGSRKIHRYSLA